MEATVKHASVFDEMDLADERDFRRAFKLAKQMIGSEPPMIDITPAEPEPEESSDE
jgi:hypothetical protein